MIIFTPFYFLHGHKRPRRCCWFVRESPDSKTGSSIHQIKVLSFQPFPLLTQFWGLYFTEWARMSLMMLAGIHSP